MKLVELKCKNCGSLLNVEEGTEEITCEYCHTKFALDDEAQHIKHDNMYESGYEFEKGRIKATEEIQNAENDDGKLKNFNKNFEKYVGTQYKSRIDELLDKVNTNNKTNSNKKIEVIYKKIKTSDSDKIIKIKHTLGDDSKNYEVILDYDNEGFVNTVTIEEIKGSLVGRIITYILTAFVIIIYLAMMAVVIKYIIQSINLSNIIDSIFSF